MEVAGSHHEDGISLVTEFTVHLAGAMTAGIDVPVSQYPQSTVADTLSRIETGRQSRLVGVQVAIEVVSQQ
jgi:hypothetical protein